MRECLDQTVWSWLQGGVVVVVVLTYLLMLTDLTGSSPLWVAPFPRLCAKCGEGLSIHERARMRFSLFLTGGVT